MNIEKLRLMKTAYSPLYQQFISIKSVRPDDNGIPIIDGEINDNGKKRIVIFRECELKKFCL